tara:strand:+ start:21965 stop:22828 length:864 start_codon:yes stop_codon:yes gene_type:complete
MFKDIVVFLPSRNNPNKLDYTLEMLIDTSYSEDNYDICCIIDSDQIELYSEVINTFKSVKFEILEHNNENYSNIMNFHFNFIENTDYYFNWWVTDDFHGLKKHWDQKIVSKKNIFSDGYYTLFTNNLMSRNINAMSNGFTKAIEPFNGYEKPICTNPSKLIYQYHEMLPICTKNWRLAIKKLNDAVGGSDHVFLNAALVHLLALKHQYSRSIEVDFYYDGIHDSGDAGRKKYEGLPRDQHFLKWSKDENYKRLLPVVQEIADDIWQHYRNRMDKPRGIGIHANQRKV